jgi:hypothetical protein
MARNQINGLEFIAIAIKGLKQNLQISPQNDELKFSLKRGDKEVDWASEYNRVINKNIPDKPGVYFWVDNNGKIIYIGVAGKINRVGKSNHTLRDRLKASRGKNVNAPHNDVTTNRFMYNLLNGKYIVKNKHEVTMPSGGFKSISIYYIKTEILPASYLEAYLIYKYFSNEQKLPILNNSF